MKTFQRWNKQTVGTTNTAHSRARRNRLNLEHLEDRITPSTFTVTDLTDNPGDTGSIRYAINQVNADSSSAADTIDLTGVSGTIILGGGALTLTRTAGAIAIAGPGAGTLTISGNHASGVFQIDSGVTASISGLTIANGTAASGGGINNQGTLTVSAAWFTHDSAASFAGGGISNSGALTVAGSTFSNNSSKVEGGGIANDGTLTVTNSSIADNSGGSFGGGIYNLRPATISNSTITGNSVTSSDGGGIYNASTPALLNTIVVGNTTANPNSASDIAGAHLNAAESAYNLIGAGGGLTNGANHNQVGVSVSSAGLGALSNYGGPTHTIALLPGSAALQTGSAILTMLSAPLAAGSANTTATVNDPTFLGAGEVIGVDSEFMQIMAISGTTMTVARGFNGTAAVAHASGANVVLPTDQRGVARPANNSDIGAFESFQAVWVDTDQITTLGARQNLVNQCAANGVNAIYISVYQSTPNSAGRYMYDDSDMAALITLAHQYGIEVWADNGAPDWPALYAASGSNSFPVQRLAEVVAYNAANPAAQFDGVMFDVEYDPTYDAASNEPEGTFLTQLVSFCEASLALLKPTGIQLGAAISAFWNPNTDPSVPTPVYQQIIGLGLNQIVVLGYRDFAGNSTEGNGIIGLDEDEFNYAVSTQSSTLIVAGLETQGPASQQTFFGDGNATMNSVMQTVDSYFDGGLGGLAGFAIDAFGNAYLSGQTNWPDSPSLAGLPVVNGSTAVINIVSATGNGATATISTDGTPHGFWVGELVTLTGVTPGGAHGLAGTVTVTGVPSATAFQFASTYNGSETLTGATVTAALAGAQRSMVDSIVYNFTEPVTLAAAAFSISVIVNNTGTGSAVGVQPTLNVAPVPFTNEWVVTFTDPVNNSVIGQSIANGAYSISINPLMVTAVSDGQTLSAGEADAFYRLYGDVTGAQSVKNVDANAFNRAWGNAYYSAGYNAALDYNDDGKYTNIDANAFNRAFNTRYSVATTI